MPSLRWCSSEDHPRQAHRTRFVFAPEMLLIFDNPRLNAMILSPFHAASTSETRATSSRRWWNMSAKRYVKGITSPTYNLPLHCCSAIIKKSKKSRGNKCPPVKAICLPTFAQTFQIHELHGVMGSSSRYERQDIRESFIHIIRMRRNLRFFSG